MEPCGEANEFNKISRLTVAERLQLANTDDWMEFGGHTEENESV
jgi:hypothetical protein